MAFSKQCPIWINKKEIQNVKAERRIAYPEAKNTDNVYSVPKPHLPSYASTLKEPSAKEMSTQTCESQILSLASVNKTNTCNSNLRTIQ